MEGIVRHSRIANPDIDIVMMHFVDPDKIKSYTNGMIPDVITNHNRVAEQYDISTINLAKEVTDRIQHKEFTWENDFKNLHPSPFGQGIYAHSMVNFLSNAFSDSIDANQKVKSHVLPKKIDVYSYYMGHLLDISSAKLGDGWSIDPLWSPQDSTGTRFNYDNVPMLKVIYLAAL